MSAVLDITVQELATPIGGLLVAADPEGFVRAVDWTDYRERMIRLLDRHYGSAGYTLLDGRIDRDLMKAMARYFDGDLSAIDRIPVRTGGTDFQRQVWTALRKLKPGEPVNYSALAEKLGRPAAARAVGHANGANPVSVVIPCHRLVGASGDLTGYAGGIERKRWLLDHESAARNRRGR